MHACKSIPTSKMKEDKQDVPVGIFVFNFFFSFKNYVALFMYIVHLLSVVQHRLSKIKLNYPIFLGLPDSYRILSYCCFVAYVCKRTI